MILTIQAIVCIVGLLMYVLASNPKVVEIGRIMFWTGLLSLLLGGHLAIPGVSGQHG
jgi:hypothetical protein